MVGDGRQVYSFYSSIKIDFLSFLEFPGYGESMLRLNFGGHLSFFNVLSPKTKTHLTSLTNNGSHRQGLCGSLWITKNCDHCYNAV